MGVIFWNVQGLFEKLKNGEIMQFLKLGDVIGVVETWLPKDFHVEISEFEFFGKGGTKRSERGRMSGGLGLFVRKDMKLKVKQCNDLGENSVLWCVLSGIGGEEEVCVAVVYNPPSASDFYNPNLFYLIRQDMEELSNRYLGSRFMIMGDFNARVGANQVKLMDPEYELFGGEEMERRSKDKITNSEGKKLLELCEEFNMVMCNGER